MLPTRMTMSTDRLIRKYVSIFWLVPSGLFSLDITFLFPIAVPTVWSDFIIIDMCVSLMIFLNIHGMNPFFLNEKVIDNIYHNSLFFC